MHHTDEFMALTSPDTTPGSRFMSAMDGVLHQAEAEDGGKVAVNVVRELIRAHQVDIAKATDTSSLEADTAARLRVVCNLLGLDSAVPEKDDELWGCAFSVLGLIRSEIERAQLAKHKDEAKPFMFGIKDPDDKPYLDEHCVDLHPEELQRQVDKFEDPGYSVVPLHLGMQSQPRVVPKYALNLLRSCASWLAARSQTVWAKEFGNSALMRSYSDDLLSIRLALAEGRDICDHCGGIIGAPLGRPATDLECQKCETVSVQNTATQEAQR